VTDPVISVLGGTGPQGRGLARRFAASGLTVVLGSRSAERAEATAVELTAAVGGTITGADNAGAAAAAQIVILAVPFRNQSETLNNVRDALRPGQLLVDATVPLAAAVGGRATRTIGVWQGSAAQQAQEMVPEGVAVVSALHTIGARPLRDLDHALDEDVLLAGDRRADKARVAALLDRIDGLRCVDCGRLEMARLTEQLTALMISVNVRYKTHAGVKITGLPGELWPAAAAAG